MTEKILYWTTVCFASLALILFVADTAMIKGNQARQAEVAQRQNVINVANNVGTLNQQLSQALVEAVVKDGDQRIRELLLSQGIVTPEKKGDVPAQAAVKPAHKE